MKEFSADILKNNLSNIDVKKNYKRIFYTKNSRIKIRFLNASFPAFVNFGIFSGLYFI